MKERKSIIMHIIDLYSDDESYLETAREYLKVQITGSRA